MSTCDQILQRSITENCNEPLVEGLERIGVIINKSDIDLHYTKTDPSCSNIIQHLSLKNGGKAFEIYQRNNAFTGTNSAAVIGTYRNSTTHQVNFVVFDNGPEVSQKIIDPLFNGEFVIILENRYKNMAASTNKGASAFQVYGYHNGMKLNAATQEKYSEETGSGWNIIMEETRAPKSAMFLYKDDYESTVSLIDSLKRI